MKFNTYLTSILHVIDARREARKAFLAFSHDDGRPQLDTCMLIKSDSENVTERSNDNDDVSDSRSTPVSNFAHQSCRGKMELSLSLSQMEVSLMLLLILIRFTSWIIMRNSRKEHVFLFGGRTCIC